ncbi:hypothetical protein [Brevibacillus daliensis]|uniref:hypothetical protein n=1 Tax=Brevibacillus daliensis TaxID=2892995 RepID=UPI001E5728E4|nr:hypothetical protein [Brevibacillus daliensis]
MNNFMRGIARRLAQLKKPFYVGCIINLIIGAIGLFKQDINMYVLYSLITTFVFTLISTLIGLTMVTNTGDGTTYYHNNNQLDETDKQSRFTWVLSSAVVAMPNLLGGVLLGYVLV